MAGLRPKGRDPLILPLVGVMAGILGSTFTPFSFREALIACALTGLLAILAFRVGASIATRSASVLVAAVFAGFALDAAHRKGPAPVLDAETGEWVLLSGCVVNPPMFHEDRGRLLLEIGPGALAQVTMYSKENETPPALRYGQRVEVEARVRKPRNFRNPGAFDYQSYLARRDVYWLASTHTSPKVDVLPGECGSPWRRVIASMRARAMENIAALYPNDDYTQGMMAAILMGETQGLDRIWTEDFRRTGTYHALVVSGAHFTSITFLFFLACRAVCAGATLRLLAGIAIGWIYTALCGWSPPVVRAAGMLTLFLVARWMFRRTRLLNLLAAVALLYLAADPGQMFEASFQLSFAAVAALGLFAEPLLEGTTGPFVSGLRGLSERSRDLRMEPRVAEFRIEMRLLADSVALWFRRRGTRLHPFLVLPLRCAAFGWELLTVSALMQITLMAPMVLYFHRVSLSGWTANLLVVPLMNIAVPAGLVATGTGWTGPAWIAKKCLEWSAAIVHWQADFALERTVPDPPLWLAAGFVVALLGAGWAIRRGNLLRIPALVVVVVLGATLAAWDFQPLREPGKLELTAVDIGQGDSLFVTFPDGKRMVVDGGGLVSFNRKRKPQIDIGQDVVSPYLWSRRTARVDILASTHAHEDHIGGLAALISNFQPRELWTGANPESEAWTNVEKAAGENGVAIRSWRAGARFAYGGATIEVLSPPADYEPATTPKNNDSLVMLIEYGSHRFLLTGDMEREMEWRIVDAGKLPRIDVLKVAHHGSKTSSTDLFLEAARPQFALISVGEGNLFRHPHPAVVERLEQSGTHVFRTDLHGLIRITSDGKRLAVHTPGSVREDFE